MHENIVAGLGGTMGTPVGVFAQLTPGGSKVDIAESGKVTESDLLCSTSNG